MDRLVNVCSSVQSRASAIETGQAEVNAYWEILSVAIKTLTILPCVPAAITLGETKSRCAIYVRIHVRGRSCNYLIANTCSTIKCHVKSVFYFPTRSCSLP